MQLHRKHLLRAGAVLGAALFGGFVLLPLLLPFVLAYLFSWWAEPAVAALGRRTKLPRWLRSSLCVTVLFAMLTAGLWLFGRVIWTEFVRLVRQLPDLLRQLQPAFDSIRGWLTGLARRAPQGFAGPAVRWIEQVFADGGLFLQGLYGFLSSFVSRVVTALPRLVLTAVTSVIATYMTSAALPELKSWLRRRLPAPWPDRLRTLRTRIHGALGGWCKAQLKMMLIVFALLTAGLWLLRVDFALLFGGLIAILDALPVLGTGTVLIPWALISFLQDNTSLGFGLLVLYGLTAFARTALEPRLVGRSLGLHPLLTLMAFYVGFRLFGVPGMVLLPLLAIVVKQFLPPAQQNEIRTEPANK